MVSDLGDGDGAGTTARVPTGRRGRPAGIGHVTAVPGPGLRSVGGRSRYGRSAVTSRLASFTVFVASGAVLVLEILAGRLLAPYIGVTLQTFTGIIGVVLTGIAGGTFLGGRLADRRDPRPLLPFVVAAGGVLAVLTVPLIRLFGPSADGAIGSIVLLASVSFLLPSAVLSAVTPMVVKICLATVDETGRVVGRLSAMGTAGSLVAVFVTGFVFVATFPTTPVVIALGVGLVALGFALWLSLGRPGDRRAVAATLVAVVASSGFALAAPGPCDVESTYFCAEVRVDPDRPTGRVLLLDSLRNSYVDLADPTYLEFGYTQILGDVVEALAPGTRTLDAVHVGGGGFTMPRYLEATRPGSTNVVFELDPSVVELAEDRLGLVPTPTTTVRTGDARVHLRALDPASADLVIGDAFGGEAVPWHLTTREFAEQIRATLRPGGVYALNLIDGGPLGFVRAEVATLRDVFAHVAVVAPAARIAGDEGGNFVVVASDAPLPTDAIRTANAARGDDDQVLDDPAGIDAFVGDARVLTDEFAPVDQLITPV